MPRQINSLLFLSALSPSIHAELWKKYGKSLPSDVTLETYLVRDRGFNETGAKDLINEYRQTIIFAGLDKPDNIPLESPNIEVGDYIQWESQGIVQFQDPKEVRAVQDQEGIKWVFVKGSETGIPMDQVTLESKGLNQPKPPSLKEEIEGTLPSDSVKEIWSLDEGDAKLILPKEISEASVMDLQFWFDGLLRKFARRSGMDLTKLNKSKESGNKV